MVTTNHPYQNWFSSIDEDALCLLTSGSHACFFPVWSLSVVVDTHITKSSRLFMENMRHAHCVETHAPNIDFYCGKYSAVERLWMVCR